MPVAATSDQNSWLVGVTLAAQCISGSALQQPKGAWSAVSTNNGASNGSNAKRQNNLLQFMVCCSSIVVGAVAPNFANSGA